MPQRNGTGFLLRQTQASCCGMFACLHLFINLGFIDLIRYIKPIQQGTTGNRRGGENQSWGFLHNHFACQAINR
jgi:hypothetical protein